jgi:hypothetical protein
MWWQPVCPGCGQHDYWSGSIFPDALSAAKSNAAPAVGSVLDVFTTLQGSGSDEPAQATVVAVEYTDDRFIPVVVMRRRRRMPGGTINVDPWLWAYRLTRECGVWIWTHYVGRRAADAADLDAVVLECRLHAMRALERGESGLRRPTRGPPC